MWKIGFSEFLGIVGVVAGILLVVLDKAGKMKNPTTLLLLLGVAAAMMLPLALGNSWVRNAPSLILKFARGGLAVCLVGVFFFGLAAWIFTSTSDDKEVTASPSLSIYPEIIKTTPELKRYFGPDSNYAIQITATNGPDKHIATNFYYKTILIDQLFQTAPSIRNGSRANDLPAGISFVYCDKINFQPPVVASYLIFAIKYQDKEVPSSKPPSEIWCFKVPEVKDDASPLHFADVSIPERESILTHLTEELKDYQK
jgi:hypothetical protein